MRDDGDVDIDAKLKELSQQSFVWTAEIGNMNETARVHIRCDNALDRA